MTQKSTSDAPRDKNGLTEEEFLKSYNPGKYPQPSLTADICVIHDGRILLIKRGGHPYINHWALPGGFANKDEPLENTASRELAEETGVQNKDMELIGVFSKPHRDPRGWVVSAAFKTVLDKDVQVKAADDAKDAAWFEIIQQDEIHLQNGDIVLALNDLAFDHGEIIAKALGQ